jgi:peroxiredoxin
MKRLKSGDRAIGFKRIDYLGKEIELNNYKGQRVLLSFFRGASCPFCKLRVNQLINRYPEFEEKQIEIITFFAASQEEISKYAGKQHAPFPIIPDPNMEVYRKYDIEESQSGMYRTMIKPVKMIQVMTSGFFNIKSIKERSIIPADFLIDENQFIYRTYYGKDFGDHLPITEILNWVK